MLVRGLRDYSPLPICLVNHCKLFHDRTVCWRDAVELEDDELTRPTSRAVRTKTCRAQRPAIETTELSLREVKADLPAPFTDCLMRRGGERLPAFKGLSRINKCTASRPSKSSVSAPSGERKKSEKATLSHCGIGAASMSFEAGVLISTAESRRERGARTGT